MAIATGVILALGSCSIGLNPDVADTGSDISEFDSIFGYTANSATAAAETLLSAANSVGASTTYNFATGVEPVAVPDPGDGTADLPARANYPYPGWTTRGTVEMADTTDWTTTPGTSYFRVTAIATPDTAGVYPETEVREVYYVASDDSIFDSGDSIHDPYGWSGSGYREEYTSTFVDGTTRRHTIFAYTDEPGDVGLAAMPISGSLDHDTVVETLGRTDANAVYSSAVLYVHALDKTFNLWYWNDRNAVEPVIIGIRYYTEHVVGSELVGTSITTEYVYNGDADRDRSYPDLLARTVIREESRFAWDGSNAGAATGHTLRMQTVINNTSGGADLVYARNGRSISEWKSESAQTNQLRGVQRDALPADYSTYATEFTTAIAEF